MASRFERMEILLAEDNPSDIELILRTLGKQDLADKGHVVRDGAEALDFIFCAGVYKARDIKKPLKAIILDLKLPKVDGKEVLRRIRSDERTKAVPVVIMSTSQEERDVFESYKLGVNSYVVKTVDYKKFSKAIAELANYWVFINRSPVFLDNKEDVWIRKQGF
jgi:CheY-like chemotaxis protein